MPELSFNVSYDDFRFLQAHMTRAIVRRNGAAYARALIGVVLCAVFVAVALLMLHDPRRLFLVAVLTACAFLALIPAVLLRLRMLRAQVSDDSPLLGPTRLVVEADGLVFDRPQVRAKYLWSAFRSAEIAKGHVILAIDKGMGLVIPADAFKSDAERYAFLAEITRHIEAAQPRPDVRRP